MNKTLQDIERIKRYGKKRNIERYGITVDEYDFLVQVQSKTCAICHDAPVKLVIDHCHKSGKVRQLLCRSCNAMLGMAGDSVEVLETAIAYLKRHHDER